MIRIEKINDREFLYQEKENNVVINEKILNDNDIVLEKKTGHYWIKFPENSMNRKLINKNKFDKNNIIIIDKVKESVSINRDNNKISKKIEDYLTDEEKSEIERILSLGKMRMKEEEEKAKKIKENPRYKELMKIKKDLENLKNHGIDIPEENFKKINEELEKMGV